MLSLYAIHRLIHEAVASAGADPDRLPFLRPGAFSHTAHDDKP